MGVVGWALGDFIDGWLIEWPRATLDFCFFFFVRLILTFAIILDSSSVFHAPPS